MDAPQIKGLQVVISYKDHVMLWQCFVKRRQPAKIATYFAFCASYFDKLVHRLYYKEVNLARFMTMSAGYSKLGEIPVWKKSKYNKGAITLILSKSELSWL